MKYYRTSQIAKLAGVHPNTIRLYEKYGLLQEIPRSNNGYRLYTNIHLQQVLLTRIAFKSEFVEGGIREKAIEILKIAANGELNKALEKANEYMEYIKKEQNKALDALQIVKKWLMGNEELDDILFLKRGDAAKYLDISIDTLRNWERNNLIKIPRNPQNGYRVYGSKEINRLKVIRTLRMANYSMMAILRMMKYVEVRNFERIKEVAYCSEDEELKSATDRWILSLHEAEKNSYCIINKLKSMLTDSNLNQRNSF